MITAIFPTPPRRRLDPACGPDRTMGVLIRLDAQLLKMLDRELDFLERTTGARPARTVLMRELLREGLARSPCQ
jgi:hypothetical protein